MKTLDLQNWRENYHFNFMTIAMGSIVILCSALSKYDMLDYVECVFYSVSILICLLILFKYNVSNKTIPEKLLQRRPW